MAAERLGDRLIRFLRADASIGYRATTALCVVVSIAAAASQEAVEVSTAAAALILVPVGFVFSYHRRGHKNVGLKIILAIGLFVAFGAFLNAVRFATSVDDTRAPLVAVFLWVQVLHSFDVPRGRDLAFSVAASVVLVALAGSLAFSSGFLVYVVLHATFFIAALVLAYDHELRNVEGTLATEAVTRRKGAPIRYGPIARRITGGVLATVLCTTVVFVFLPRLPAQQVAALPFSFPRSAPIPGFAGDVALPSGGTDGGDSEDAFDPEIYFGYGDSLNLRVRGRLADVLVMRVRAPEPSLYRGQVYDSYVDGRWSSSDTQLEELRSGGDGSVFAPTLPGEQGAGDELVQTFYVERELPNIVFHAQRARELYVSETRVLVDDFGSFRLPFTIEEDTIYSVISEIPVSDPEILRQALPPDRTRLEIDRYLQLPESLEGRFSDLAIEITEPHLSPVDKAIAVESWIKQNKRYRLDISRDPPQVDPVDYFVFDRDEGFCEQIAATMALMLRAAGVPTRLVTGFGPGARNLFTGYWEVNNTDAHAWVEVLYPGYGWVPYDPTFGVPDAGVANTTFMLGPLKKISEFFSSGVFGEIRRALGEVVDVIPGPRWIGAPVLLLLLAAVAEFVRRNLRRRRPVRDAPDPALDTWFELEAALAAQGWERRPHETVLEFASRVPGLVVDRALLREVAHGFNAFRYSPEGSAGDGFDEWRRRTQDTADAVRRET